MIRRTKGEEEERRGREVFGGEKNEEVKGFAVEGEGRKERREEAALAVEKFSECEPEEALISTREEEERVIGEGEEFERKKEMNRRGGEAGKEGSASGETGEPAEEMCRSGRGVKPRGWRGGEREIAGSEEEENPPRW